MEVIIIIGIIIFLWWLYENCKYVVSSYIDRSGIDKNGYKRNIFGDLVHRNIAYNQLYDYPKKHNKRFRNYDVHHIDRNKTNNSPDNLLILTREEHKAVHGI